MKTVGKLSRAGVQGGSAEHFHTIYWYTRARILVDSTHTWSCYSDTQIARTLGCMVKISRAEGPAPWPAALAQPARGAQCLLPKKGHLSDKYQLPSMS